MTDFCGIPLASLRENSITELNLERKGIGVPGAIVLSKLLPSAAALTLLKCAAAPSRACQAPMTLRLPFAHSIEGHPLPIDELKGTKPTEKIDLSDKGLGVASTIIIASCIKDNGSLKELRYGAHLHTIPHSRSAPDEHFPPGSQARKQYDWWVL